MEMGSVNFADITATAFAIAAVGGDNFYSVSELQSVANLVGPVQVEYRLPHRWVRRP